MTPGLRNQDSSPLGPIGTARADERFAAGPHRRSARITPENEPLAAHIDAGTTSDTTGASRRKGHLREPLPARAGLSAAGPHLLSGGAAPPSVVVGGGQRRCLHISSE
jgi:hypothetical protein